MINGIQRRIVEMVKASKGIDIIINPDDRLNRMHLTRIEDKKFSHDVALALQTYLNTHNNNDD